MRVFQLARENNEGIKIQNMAMMNYKEFAESILSDLMGNVSLSDILLKMKIFASKKGDKELLTWISKELAGYENEKPPKYRIIPSGLKVDVFVPFRGTSRIDFPAEMIKDREVREKLLNLPFNNPIAEIESLCKEGTEDGFIHAKVHAYAYQFISEFINGDIQGATQFVTKASVSQIPVAVKSVIIDFMLKISNEEEIDFNTFIKSNSTMSTNINITAGILNTGNGVVNAQGSTNVVGENTIVNGDNKEELLKLIAEIDKMASVLQNAEYNEVSNDIRTELHKDVPSKSYLKRCFQAIPSILTGVGTGVVANGISPLVKAAIALLI